MEYHGIFRGFIAATDDPDKRYQYRVRVLPFHASDAPVANLPFASICCFVGKNFGDVPHYEVGDAVIVMFEHGDPAYPIIMGSWIAGQRNEAARTYTPDFPPDQTGEYEDRRKRWERVDRDGNRIVMIEGAADDEDSIIIEAKKKLKIIVGKPSEENHNDDLTITVDGDYNLTVEGATNITLKDNATIVCEKDADITVQRNLDVTVQEDATINVTQDADVNVQGQLNAQVQGDVTVQSAGGKVHVEAASDVELQASGKVAVTAPDIELAGTDPIVTESKLALLYNTHVHPDPVSGNTGAPTVPIAGGNASSSVAKAAT